MDKQIKILITQIVDYCKTFKYSRANLLYATDGIIIQDLRETFPDCNFEFYRNHKKYLHMKVYYKHSLIWFRFKNNLINSIKYLTIESMPFLKSVRE